MNEEEMRKRDDLLDIIDELVTDISMLAPDDGWKALKSVARAREVSPDLSLRRSAKP